MDLLLLLNHLFKGPENYPIVGGAPILAKLDPVTAVAYKKLGDTYGPLTAVYFGRHLGLVVNGFDTIREILTREEFSGRPNMFNVLIKPVNKNANETGKKYSLNFIDY